MKKWMLRIVLTLLVVFLLLGFIPFSKEIYYADTAYEFSLATDGAVAEHEVLIDGTYSSILFLKDRFWGTLYVSDAEGLTEEMTVNFSFEPGKRYHPAFQDEAGQLHSTEVAVLFFEENFDELAIQFAYKYEKTEDSITAGYGDGVSNFLVLGAASKEEALKVYSRMLEEKQW